MHMDHAPDDIVDWPEFQAARAQMGPAFIRILGYFREDGEKAVADIESAVREQNATKLVLPAHKLKGEARQFGAEKLADLAELIEDHARHCVETRDRPDEIVPHVVGLRPLFEATLNALEAEVNPLVQRRRAAGPGPFG